jgi:hypothetical protein
MRGICINCDYPIAPIGGTQTSFRYGEALTPDLHLHLDIVKFVLRHDYLLRHQHFPLMVIFASGQKIHTSV